MLPLRATALRRRSRWAAALLLVAVAACSSQESGEVGPYTSDEPFAQRDADLGSPASEPLLEDAAARSDKETAAASRLGASAKRKVPDTGSLSELDYRNAQNQSQQANEALDYLGPQKKLAKAAASASLGGEGGFADRQELRRLREIDSAEGFLPNRPEPATTLEELKIAAESERVTGELAAADPDTTVSGGSVRDDRPAPLTPAQRFRQERRTLEGLRFQPSSGYWANTYVPGDPVLRWLQSRLKDDDRARLEALAAHPLSLEAAAHPTDQPFDPPGSAALSVFVHADRRGLEREERMLVQVGLQGARRRSGLRPAMSVGIVLDVRSPLSSEAAASMRALLEAFLQAKDVGDRFSLTLAGAPGGRLVNPEQFRHGPLSLAMRRIAGAGMAPPPGPTLDLVEAVRQTASELQRGDDPTAPLGSSLVLLVTSQPLGARTESLVSVAHRSAVAGVPVSAVVVGDTADLGEIERVILAGQGNRRLLGSPDEAEALVGRELSSLARVIARALRLNIRLAPGVKLVEVVGAERLDAAGAQQVRRAERSIDRRLARSLGIEADRGEDEDGIQIVIPTFSSGDSHAVLLDVVASGPGPIADVTVRYKDLVYLRNSVARANLTLSSRRASDGPLERNVVKNYIAARLAAKLKQAGRALLEGADAEAVATVAEFRDLIASLQEEVPGFQNDAELAADHAMLGEYLALLQTQPILDGDGPRRALADVLQLSGYFKTVPRAAPALHIARR